METNNEVIEEIEVEETDGGGGGHWPPVQKSKCVAQVSPDAKEVTVKATDCCNNIIARATQNLDVVTKEVKASIIKGKVICNSNMSSGVEGAIVVATAKGSSTPCYVGITNYKGEYSICVPAPASTSDVIYSVEAYFVSGCVGNNLCPPAASCDSKCK